MSELMGRVALRGMGVDIDRMKCELSAASEERDFFKEKYIAQIDEIKALQKELRSSKNEIMRLREELVNIEMLRKLDLNENESCEPTTVEKFRASDTTQSTCSTNDSDEECPEQTLDESSEEVEPEVGNTSTEEEQIPVTKDAEDNGDDDSDEEEEEEDDEDDTAIRDRAAKMLIWANYQEARGRVGSSSNLTSPASSIRSPSQATGAVSRNASVNSIQNSRRSISTAPIPETIHATPSDKREELPESVRQLLDLDDESSIEENESDSDYESDEE